MTPTQKLYCEVLRVCRGKAITMAEARRIAHKFAAYYQEPAGARDLHRSQPLYPWSYIDTPSTPRWR